tara:strand:- start:335 stop:604 length:270 start_codon:yes stop_codon:yes gene_type:complete
MTPITTDKGITMFNVAELEEVFLNEDKYTIENIGGGIDHAIVEQVSKIARQGVVVTQVVSEYHYYTITSFYQNDTGHWTIWNSIMRYAK